MTKRTQNILAITLTLTLIALTGCGDAGDSAAPHKAPPANVPTPGQPTIEESDLYRLDGDTLYVQNQDTGLNIIDVTVPSKPKLVGRAPSGGATGGEMYIRPTQAIILLKETTSACLQPKNLNPNGWKFKAEVVFVDLSSKTHPRVISRYCIPGSLVDSRTVDNILYIVSSGPAASRVIAIDISDTQNAAVLDTIEFAGESKQISLTATTLMVASFDNVQQGSTLLERFSIDNKGSITPRGQITVNGTPQGRFHQQLHNNQFRIVTYDESARRSILTIVDISDLTKMSMLGSLPNIGQGEKLYATRFEANWAYVVTFRRTDPLWIIDLSLPSKPELVGELHVPGWSDFIFPRGKRLVTVGRGNNGNGLGVSLFDVSDPTNPRSLSQITLGASDTSSAANVDHRAVTILDQPGGNALVLVPHTTVSYGSSCDITDHLQLVEVMPDRLQVRGVVKQRGTIHRSLLVKSALYSISDHEILSVDIKDIDHPRIDTAITTGSGEWQDPNRTSYCSNYNPNDYTYYGHDDYDSSGPFMFRCDLGAAAGTSAPPVSVAIGMVWLGLWFIRRRRR
jgi:uncharacterized secreted protein with C-terminal beta-propeller domain